MLLTISCEGARADDFGFLLHKHPDSIFRREVSFGRVTVFYPESGPSRATVAMLVEVDPVHPVRGRDRATPLAEYVNDRPYVASSLTSVALREAFSTALAGRSRDRQALVNEPLELSARIPAVVVKGGAAMATRLFAPLGYSVTATTHALDPSVPEWGDASLLSLQIAGRQTVQDLLAHLYVLLPVLDTEKHYFVGDAEVEKLRDHGARWLDRHPEKLLISNRFLKYQRPLVHAALSQLTVETAAADDEDQSDEDAIESRVSLADQRIAAVVRALRFGEPPFRRIADIGCGEGRLLATLAQDRGFTEIVGADVSSESLSRAERRLELDRPGSPAAGRVTLLQSSLLYHDRRLDGFDAITLIEVIEHVDLERLDLLKRIVFDRLKPRRVVITTPNVDYNVRFDGMRRGALRHRDHRFEWSRAQFRTWCESASPDFSVQFADVGPVDRDVGAPTQMAIFDRRDA